MTSLTTPKYLALICFTIFFVLIKIYLCNEIFEDMVTDQIFGLKVPALSPKCVVAFARQDFETGLCNNADEQSVVTRHFYPDR